MSRTKQMEEATKKKSRYKLYLSEVSVTMLVRSSQKVLIFLLPPPHGKLLGPADIQLRNLSTSH